MRERAHIVEGLLRVLDERLEFIELLGSSADRQTARDALISDWRLSETQATLALDMPFSRSTKQGRDDLAQELSLLQTKVEDDE